MYASYPHFLEVSFNLLYFCCVNAFKMAAEIHMLLEYVCTKENHELFNTEEIAKALKLSVPEVNVYCKQLELAGDAVIDHSDDKDDTWFLHKTNTTLDAFFRGKYEN